MARRFPTQGIRKARVYTIKVAAQIVGVSEPTFRKWRQDGLKIISDKRPFLVRGADLIDYLNKKQAANLRPMTQTQCYCMRCKSPRDALEGAFIYRPMSNLTGRLSGLCAGCGGKFGRFCKAADLELLEKVLTISRKPSA